MFCIHLENINQTGLKFKPQHALLQDEMYIYTERTVHPTTFLIVQPKW